MDFRDPTNSERKYIRTVVPSTPTRVVETCTSAFFITLVLSLFLYFVLLLVARSIPTIDRIILIIIAACIGYIFITLRLFSMIQDRDKHINLLRNGNFLVTTCKYDYMYDDNKISVKTDMGSRLVPITGTLGGYGIEDYPKGTEILICKLSKLEQSYVIPTEEELKASVEK